MRRNLVRRTAIAIVIAGALAGIFGREVRAETVAEFYKANTRRSMSGRELAAPMPSMPGF